MKARVPGIEPETTVLETVVLPLNYTHGGDRRDSNPDLLIHGQGLSL
jgi:hypothetical protein